MRRIAGLLCVLLAMTVLPGCNGVYYDDVPVTVGRWVLVESDGMPVPEAYADYYDFFENGDGLHSYYDYYGRFVSDPFVWDIRRPGELYIRYLDYSIGSYFLSVFVSVGLSGFLLLRRLCEGGVVASEYPADIMP